MVQCELSVTSRCRAMDKSYWTKYLGPCGSPISFTATFDVAKLERWPDIIRQVLVGRDVQGLAGTTLGSCDLVCLSRPSSSCSTCGGISRTSRGCPFESSDTLPLLGSFCYSSNAIIKGRNTECESCTKSTSKAAPSSIEMCKPWIFHYFTSQVTSFTGRV